MCQKMNDNKRIQVGRRFGQLGLKLLNQSESSMSVLPLVHVMYYGFVGILFEPIQSVIEMHRKASEVALQVGSLWLSAMHKIFQVAREFHSGTNLLKMKENLERYLKEEEYHTSFQYIGGKLNGYQKVILTLIGECIHQDCDEESELFDSEPSVSVKVCNSAFLLNHLDTSCLSRPECYNSNG